MHSLVDERAPEVYIWRSPATLSLAAHAVLASRWNCLLPLIFHFTGSFDVAAQLAGHFCGWAVFALLADMLTVMLVRRPSRVGSTHLDFCMVATCVAIFVLFIAILFRRAGNALGLHTEGLLAALLWVVLMVAAAIASACRRSWTPLLTMRIIIESFLELAAGVIIYFLASCLFADGKGHLEARWTSLWRLCLSSLLVCILAVAVQWGGMLWASRCCSRWLASNRTLNLELVPQAYDDFAGALGQSRKACLSTTISWCRRKTVLTFLTTYALGGFLMALYYFYLSGVYGEIVDDSLPHPDCTGCFCTARFPTSSIMRIPQVAYRTVFDPLSGERRTLYLDIYARGMPVNVSTGAVARPAMLLIHGGDFNGGDKRETRLYIEAIELARRGFVTFIVDYRLEAPTTIPEDGAVMRAVSDAKAAVRFIVKNAADLGVDIHRIGAWGSSAGAIIAASMSHAPNDLGAEDELYDDEKVAVLSNSNISVAVGLSGCIWPLLVSREPAAIPWLNIHGDHDFIVPVFLAEATMLFLRDMAKLPAEANRLLLVPGAGHVPWLSPTTADAPPPMEILRPHVVAFLVRFLRLDDAPCAN